MTLLISFAFVMLLLGLAVWKMLAANREVKRVAKVKEEMRRKKEEEILHRLKRIKNRDDRDRAQSAIDKDPERAAKVVGKMMKKQ